MSHIQRVLLGFIAVTKYHDFIRSLLWEFSDGKLQCIVDIGVV
mgnify:CR=1 FL=1